jgi:hypothetical protein
MNKAMTTSKSPSYRTPKAFYDKLDAEFHFNDDPCPLSDNGIDGLLRSWGTSTFLNPPYGKNIDKWMMKAYQESRLGKIVVCLVPSRTDTRWWHEWAMKAETIRFVKGRLTFDGEINPAPFPNAILIFKES